MKDKDFKKIENMIRELLEDLLGEEIEPISLHGYTKANFPYPLIQEMEAFLGHEIDFMGIS